MYLGVACLITILIDRKVQQSENMQIKAIFFAEIN